MNQINRIGQNSADDSLIDLHNKGMLVYRPALVEAEHFAGFCLIRCISNSALIGRFHGHLAEGTPAVVSFNETISASGTVVQSPSGWLEVSLHPEIHASRLLAVLARPLERGKANRALRLDIKEQIEVLCEDGSIWVEMTNISQKGLRLRSASLTLGSEIIIRIPNFVTLKAHVRWAQHGEVGLTFFNPLNFQELGKWCFDHSFRYESCSISYSNNSFIPLDGQH